MPKHWLRNCVTATICGLVPLIPASPVHASSPIHAASPAVVASAVPESAILQKFRDSGPPVMQEAAQFEATAATHGVSRASAATTRILQAPSNPRLFREVFGFAFASSLGDPTIGYPSWNFSLLSTVAYFGVHVAWTGDFSNDSGLTTWNDPYGPVPGFIQTAHANGTKVVLTIEMFDSTNGTPNMCSALQRGSLTIQRTVAQVVARGIDGVNIDYESDNTLCTDPSTGAVQSSQSLFTSFVKNMRAALPSGSYLTLDSYSGAAGYRDNSGAYLGFFDIGALATYVDAFFVMAYDMEYANWGSPPLSCPNFCIGPTAPLSTYLFNDGRASSEYTAVVPASKVIMGIPYYGRKECVAGYTPANAPANAVGSTIAVADGYLDASTENGYSANSDYHIHYETRDPLSRTRWDTFTSSTAQCTREMYWDDVTGLGNKYNLVINNHLRGAGIFALNYGGGAPELWSLINLKFGQCSEAAIAADKTSPQIPGAKITFTGSALCAGTAQYRFWLRDLNGAWTIKQDYSTTATWTWDSTGKALGTYQIEVDLRNLGSSVAYDTVARMDFRLANCSTPVLSADHASPQLPGTTVTFTAVGTCQGTPQYQFSRTSPGGTATIVQPYSTTATYAWDNNNTAYGAYSITVDVRVPSSTLPAEASRSMQFSRTSCIGPNLATDKTSPQSTGTPIGLTGSATCTGTPMYRFRIQPPGGALSTVQDFGSATTFAWNGGGPGGTFTLGLDAKGGTTDPSTMVSSQVTFVLTSCSSVALATSPSSPQTPGTSVLLTGTATCPSTPEYRFVVKSPAAVSTTVQDYGNTNTFSWNTTALALGDYTLEVDVRDVGATTLEASATATYTIANPACSAPTLTSDLSSPQGTGGAITFSATTTTCPSPLFKFWVETPDFTWTVVQDYSLSKTYRWPAAGPVGNYRIEVDVRDSTRPVTYDHFGVVPYVLTGCTGAALTPNPAPPQEAGTQVVVTGSATCPRAAQYRFWVSPPSGGWTTVQDYSSSSTYAWRSTSGGNYRLEVDVRDVGASAAYETYTTIPFALVAPCSTPSLSASPTSGATGSSVMFTSSTSSCPIPSYRFWVGQSGRWHIVQDYGGANTFSWPGSGAAGTFGVEVDVREAGSSVPYDAVRNMTYSVSGCTAAHLAGDKVSPQAPGTTLMLTASANCPGAPDYRFWVGRNAMWTIAQDFSAAGTFSWNTTGKLQGTYGLEVDVRDHGATATYEAVANITFVLFAPPCTTPGLTAAPVSPEGSGAHVTLTASTSGCPNPQYRFWISPPSGMWSMVQDYSSTNTYSWINTGADGTYRIEVDVRDASTTVVYDRVTSIIYVLTACTLAHLTPDKPSPQVHGTTITLTGSATCAGTPEYRFWVRDLSGKWTIAQDFSTSNQFRWSTTGLPPGVYGLEVDVRNQGSTATYETVANITFKVT